MTSTTLKNLIIKLKNLPDNLVNEVDAFVDYVIHKNAENQQEIPDWQKELVLKRVNDNLTPIDAFEMLDAIESEK